MLYTQAVWDVVFTKCKHVQILEKNCMFWEHYLKSEIKSSGPNVLLGFSALSEIITNKLYIRKKKKKDFFI